MLKKEIKNLIQEWYWFNAGWCVQDEYTGGVHYTGKWYNWPQRVVSFVWIQWIAARVCTHFGHKWEKVTDDNYTTLYSVCSRCGVDTDITIYE